MRIRGTFSSYQMKVQPQRDHRLKSRATQCVLWKLSNFWVQVVMGAVTLVRIKRVIGIYNNIKSF
jgi:hypothetical protein